MASYWLKIFLGALLVFAVGLGAVTLVRKASDGVHYVSETSGPISIPFFFVPFEVDGRSVGTIRRLNIYRDSTRHPTSVSISIAADSGQVSGLASCILAARTSGEQATPNQFECLTAGDTAGKNLVEFGQLTVRDQNDSFALLAPRAMVVKLRDGAADDLSGQDDAARQAVDSANTQRRQLIDSIRQAARESAETARTEAQRVVDSIQSAIVR